ncbi:MAG: GEVED domain-containing protein [Anaerolineae bacterium]|nr:GEVED domain-containing protein [Anaerolineae bacterium]
MSTGPEPTTGSRFMPRLIGIVVITAVAMLVASVAFAGWTTINLTNGGIDGTWGTQNYSEPTNDAGINDRDDIRYAWVRYDGSNIYFRIQTWTGPVLSNTNYRAVGAIDCNHDGDFNDPVSGPDGDRLIIYAPDNTVNIYGYTSGGSLTFVGPVTGDWSDPTRASVTTNIEWGVPLSLLPPTCRASVSPVNIAWSTGTGAGVVIDQSSTLVELSNPMDFGDTVQTLPAPPATCAAPDTATGLQCDGARHGIVPMTPGVPLRLGSEAVDADPGNLQSAGSDADDTDGTTPDDEAGIYPDDTNSWSDGSGSLSFTIVGAASARVGCWIDFNKNGVWTDPGEVVINNATIGAATTSRGITIPGGQTWPNSFPARCRIWQNPGANTPTPVPAPNGPIEFGEVEDHIWEFDAAGIYVGPGGPQAPTAATNLAIITVGTNDVELSWDNPAPNNGARLLGHATNPYFTSANGPFAPDYIDSASPWVYQHTNTRGTLPPDTIYYIVYGRLGTTEAATPSNRVGLFEFELTEGTP